MNEAELIFTALAELSTRQIAESVNATGGYSISSFHRLSTIQVDVTGHSRYTGWYPLLRVSFCFHNAETLSQQLPVVMYHRG